MDPPRRSEVLDQRRMMELCPEVQPLEQVENGEKQQSKKGKERKRDQFAQLFDKTKSSLKEKFDLVNDKVSRKKKRRDSM